MKIRFSSSLSNEKPVTYKITDLQEQQRPPCQNPLFRSRHPYGPGTKLRTNTFLYVAPIVPKPPTTQHCIWRSTVPKFTFALFRSRRPYSNNGHKQRPGLRITADAKITDAQTLYLALHRAKIHLCALPVRITADAKITDGQTLYLALHRAKIHLCALPFKASLQQQRTPAARRFLLGHLASH
jgi:hypothetical protein